MSSNTNLDNCECEANLFLKKYRSKIEGLFRDERRSLKKVAEKTSDYGTFKEPDQESFEDITKIKKGTKDAKTIEKSKLTGTKDTKQPKTIEKSTEISAKDTKQSKPTEKSKLIDTKTTKEEAKPFEKTTTISAKDARRTKPIEKSKITESKQKLQLDKDKRRKSEESLRSSAESIGEQKDSAVSKADSSRISLQEEKLRSQIKIQESKLKQGEKELELLKKQKSKHRIEEEKLDISKKKLTTDEEIKEKEVTPEEYSKLSKDQDKLKENLEISKVREKLKEETSEISKDQDKQKEETSEISKDQEKQKELTKKDSIVIIYEKEPQIMRAKDDEEELKVKQKMYKTKIEETLKYLHEQKMDGEEYEMERDYSKIFSKLRSSAEEDDNFLFKPSDMHPPGVVVPDSQKQAEEYLETHKIYQFFHFLLAHLVAENSTNPISYLISLLNECIKYRAKCCKPPLLFQKKHIESLFNSMDPMQTGFININQYHTAMMTLGIGIYRKRPSLTKDNMVTREEFIEEALKQLTYQLDEMIKTTAQPSTTTVTSYESGYSTPYG